MDGSPPAEAGTGAGDARENSTRGGGAGGGGTMSRPPDASPVAPRAGGGGNGGGFSTGGLPPGPGGGTGPSMRQEGVYTPRAHEGALERGDGPESLVGGGVTPGRWQGGPLLGGAVAERQGTQPPGHCGCPARSAWPGTCRAAHPPPPREGL